MRLLFADTFSSTGLTTLTEAGHDCVVEPGLDEATIPTRIGGFDALVVRSTKVTAATIAAGDRLGLIVRAGAGTNTIDKEAAAGRGVYVCNVPGKNAVAVAELAMGLMLGLDRRIPDAVADLRQGRWRKKFYSQADGLAGKTLGLVGLGSIGLEVARRATAFRLNVLAVDRPGREPATVAAAFRAGVAFVQSDAELFSRADILSFHVPLNESTRGLVNAELLALCRDGTWIINTSRGEIVDEPALLQALTERGMRAGLDVFADEPAAGEAEFRSELAAHPSVYGTHHIGASTEQAQQAIADGVVEVIDSYERGQVVNCVNLETRPRGTCAVVVRHLNRVGVLSEVLGVLRAAAVNVEQMDNRVLLGGTSAVASLRLDRSIDDALIDEIRGTQHVLSVGVRHEEPIE